MSILERFYKQKAEEQLEAEPTSIHENVVDEAVDQELKNLYNHGVMIDFSKMNVFSIERSPFFDGDGNITSHATVIGYHHKNEVREWTLYISKDAHDALILAYAQFKKDHSVFFYYTTSGFYHTV